MKLNNPHFRYNKRQRNGVFYFLLVIIMLQIGCFFIDDVLGNKNISVVIDKDIEKLRAKVDSLQLLGEGEKKIYKTNPNFITDEKGYLLGMSVEEIDRVLEYRATGLWINDLKSFQKISLVSDSLLNVLSAQLTFPNFKVREIKKRKISKKQILGDLNAVDSIELKAINGVGKVLSVRIVKYRTKLQGFSDSSQLAEVYGLSKIVCNRILNKFEIKQKPKIQKVDVNSASFKAVLSVVYLDYDTTKMIFKYRNQVGRIEKLSELKKIAGFPIDKYERIALYLQAK